jgi:hypothetical protein
MKDPIIAQTAHSLLKAQTKAAQHLENCVRCKRLFVSLLEATAEDEQALLHSLGEGAAFGLTAKIIRELRTCPEWPADV